MASAVLGSSLEHIGVVSVAQMPCAIEENRRSRGAEGLEDVNSGMRGWQAFGGGRARYAQCGLHWIIGAASSTIAGQKRRAKHYRQCK
jgi:hypothetical protein